MFSQISLIKTRLLFITFFLALAIPSGILSYKANEQLRFQGMHQYRLEAQSLVEQIDNALQQAILKEETRSDTEYTFFVLTGSPEARLVQRSELSKFPVEPDLPGVIGYFQVDADGNFSSPILPSAYVQSAVHSQLYGISPEENALRNQVQKRVIDVLLENRLVVNNDVTRKALVNLETVSDEMMNEKLLENELGKIERREAEENGDVTGQKLESDVPEDKLIITGSRIKRNSTLPSKLEDSGSKKLAKEAKISFNQLAQQENVRNQNALDSERKRQSLKTLLDSKYKSSKKSVNKRPKRGVRVEQNYSPQQQIPVKQSSSSVIDKDRIQIHLFESTIEPFKFSLLESGDFVMYRQVWQNNKRIIQGAVVSAKDFIENTMSQKYRQSLLAEETDLRIFYAGENIHTENKISSSDVSIITEAPEPPSEMLLTMSLGEPFNQFEFVFSISKTLQGAGAGFIKILVSSLMLILILGTYFLYRMTLKQSNLARQQQDFVSSVSHELKTPLTSIRMYGEILKQGWVSEEKKNEYYDYIYSESERLSRLIANVLQIAKVNHNALELSPELFEVKELISVLESKLDSQIHQSGFNLFINADKLAADRSINLDIDVFIQIVINLVDNAIKYTGDNDDKRIDITFSIAPNDDLSVSVRDYGPGIAKSELKNVFNLFYRVGDEMTRTATGTGIGLALVKELSQAMRGSITAVQRDPGIEFSLHLSKDALKS